MKTTNEIYKDKKGVKHTFSGSKIIMISGLNTISMYINK
jgi:hypothetical protein